MSTALVSPAIEENNFQALVDTATRIIKDGQLEEARRTCQSLTETHPEQPGAWFLFGGVAMEDGDMAAAIPAFERAVALHRGNAAFACRLGHAYRTAGRTDDAAAMLEKAHHLDPDHPETMLSLGLIRIEQGRQDAGVKLCRRGFSALLRRKFHRILHWAGKPAAIVMGASRHLSHPVGDRAAWIAAAQAEICRWLGDDDDAIAHYMEAVEIAPDHLPFAAELSRLFVIREQFAEALPYLERLAPAFPDNLTIQTDYAAALAHFVKFDAAMRVLDAVQERGDEAPRALLVLAKAQTGLGDTKAALQTLKRALTLAPNSAEVHFALGRNLQEDGEIEQANRYFFDTLEIDQTHAGAFRFLASNQAVGPRDEICTRVLEHLGTDTGCRADRLRLHFAMGTIFERAGDTDRAFDHYAAGNDLKDVVFDPDNCATFIGRLTETFDKDFFARIQAWGAVDDCPVFVVGMPRSGTTLVEQILASHPKVFGAGELETFNEFADGLAGRLETDTPYPDCAQRLDAESVAAMAGEHLTRLRSLDQNARRIVDKMPTNFLHVGLIAALFPKARIIHCRRDPRDTCFSIYGLDFAGAHNYAYEQTNLGRYYRQYERLMDHWQRVVPTPILDMHYEDLIADQEGSTRRLLEFCGLEWDNRCLDFHKTERTVRTWSYNQVRQPIYNSSVARWRKFERYLKPLLDELNIKDTH